MSRRYKNTVTMTISGAPELLYAFNKAGKEAENDLDEKLRHSMERTQIQAFKRTPVDTGFLSSNIVAPENVRRVTGIYSQKDIAYELLEGTEYGIYQEFNHATKSAFVRTSVREEHPKLRAELNTWGNDLLRRFYK